MAAQGVIYSDFDGVHNVPQRPGLLTAKVSTAGSRFFRQETTVAWDPEILELFAELIGVSGFELEWLTTWNENSLIRSAAKAMEFPHRNHAHARLNVGASSTKSWTAWKARHIIADQRANPRPFLWIDDKAPLHWGEIVAQSTSAPSLILTTNSRTGLTRENVLQIVLWLESIRGADPRSAAFSD